MSRKEIVVTDNLLVKYLLGEADADERARVSQWAEEDERNQKQLDDFKLILERSAVAADQSTINEHEALARLHTRLGRNTPQKSTSNLGWLRIAASVILVGALAAITYYSWFAPATQLFVQSGTATLRDTLPDGSVIMLNKNSGISYPDRFSGSSRTVTLQGEAFFDVAPNKSKPFIIRVGDVTVQVVGTSFNVKSRGDETAVTVETGIVKVNTKHEHAALEPGDKVVVRAGEKFVKERAKGKLYNYYYSNELVCNETPLFELVEILNEKFDASIVIAKPSLRTLPISTVFRNESLDEILSVIAQTFNISIEHRGNKILLK